MNVISCGRLWAIIAGIFFLQVFSGFDGLAQSTIRSYGSLELPVHALQSALGGINVSDVDKEVSFFQNNPALSSDSLNGWGSLSHMFYFADIGYSTFVYQHNFKNIGALSFAVNHLNFGNIEGYDNAGVPIGTYQSGESTIVIGKFHQVGSFRIGANIKGIFSNVTGYRSNALSFDLGGVFVHPTEDLNVGLVFKNIGFVMGDYSATSSSKLPLDIQVGISYKPEHMPMRISTTIYRLVDYDTPYYNSNDANEEPATLDKVMSHLTFGGELIVHKNISLLMGYNFLRHQELKMEEAGGGSGFSIGAFVKLSSFNLALSRSGYVTSGAYQVSFGLDTNKIVRRK